MRARLKVVSVCLGIHFRSPVRVRPTFAFARTRRRYLYLLLRPVDYHMNMLEKVIVTV